MYTSYCFPICKVEASTLSLDPTCSFVLDAGLKIYIWSGERVRIWLAFITDYKSMSRAHSSQCCGLALSHGFVPHIGLTSLCLSPLDKMVQEKLSYMSMSRRNWNTESIYRKSLNMCNYCYRRSSHHQDISPPRNHFATKRSPLATKHQQKDELE